MVDRATARAMDMRMQLMSQGVPEDIAQQLSVESVMAEMSRDGFAQSSGNCSVVHRPEDNWKADHPVMQACLGTVTIGCRCKLMGLFMHGFNGMFGTVEAWNHQLGRWRVKLDDRHKPVNVLRSNLEVCASQDEPLAGVQQLPAQKPAQEPAAPSSSKAEAPMSPKAKPAQEPAAPSSSKAEEAPMSPKAETPDPQQSESRSQRPRWGKLAPRQTAVTPHNGMPAPVTPPHRKPRGQSSPIVDDWPTMYEEIDLMRSVADEEMSPGKLERDL